MGEAADFGLLWVGGFMAGVGGGNQELSFSCYIWEAY